MRVDPLEVAQHVEVERAGFDTLDPAGADAGEMRLGRTGFEIAKYFLFAEQLARGAHIAGHEHGRRRAHIRRETAEHLADLGGPFGRKSEIALSPLCQVRRHPPFDDVAGMFKIGYEGEDLR